MKYFLIWDYGSCNEGDHTTGIGEYDLLESAQAEGERIDQRNGGYGSYTIIFGTEITS